MLSVHNVLTTGRGRNPRRERCNSKHQSLLLLPPIPHNNHLYSLRTCHIPSMWEALYTFNSLRRGASFWHKGSASLPRHVTCCLKEVNRTHRKVLNRLAKIFANINQQVSGRNSVGSSHEMEEIWGKLWKEREAVYWMSTVNTSASLI